MNYLLEALIRKLEDEIAVARANVEVYIKGSVGIGEHPYLVGSCRQGWYARMEAIESQINLIAEAEDKIETINKHFGFGE